MRSVKLHVNECWPWSGSRLDIVSAAPAALRSPHTESTMSMTRERLKIRFGGISIDLCDRPLKAVKLVEPWRRCDCHAP